MENESSLVRRVLAGDESAWIEFVARFGPYLSRIVGRYVADGDEAENRCVEILEKVKNGKLERFDFRSKISTWLFVVARNHCRDYYRRGAGVRHVAKAVEGLGPLERRFFRLRYLDNLPVGETFESMRAEFGREMSYLVLHECNEAIRRCVGEQGLGRLLDRLDKAHDYPVFGERPTEVPFSDDTLTSPDLPPDATFEERDLDLALEHLRQAILRLPHRDQLILQLRFEHRKSAREIGEIMDLSNEKQVYRQLDRLFGELRGMLLESGLPADTCREVAEDIERYCARQALWRETGSRGDAIPS